MKGFMCKMLMAMLLLPSLVHANAQQSSGSWKVESEFLYLLPMISQSYYAQSTISPALPLPGGKRYANELHFHSGYRLKASYNFCDPIHDFLFAWTHLPRFHDSDSFQGNLVAVQRYPLGSGTFRGADSKITFSYCALDALWGFFGYQSCSSKLQFRAGLHYAKFDFKQQLLYLVAQSTLSETVEFNSDTWGVGPEFMLDMHYIPPFFQNLMSNNNWCGFTSCLKGGLLASTYRPSFEFLNPGGTLLISAHDATRWDLIPFWDIRLGIKYCKTFCSLTASLEIGYEMLAYHNAIARLEFVDDVSRGASIDLYSNANFQGPYLALGLTF